VGTGLHEEGDWSGEGQSSKNFGDMRVKRDKRDRAKNFGDMRVKRDKRDRVHSRDRAGFWGVCLVKRDKRDRAGFGLRECLGWRGTGEGQSWFWFEGMLGVERDRDSRRDRAGCMKREWRGTELEKFWGHESEEG